MSLLLVFITSLNIKKNPIIRVNNINCFRRILYIKLLIIIYGDSGIK